MVRRDQLQRGVAWSHSMDGDPHYLALGVEDYKRVGKPAGDEEEVAFGDEIKVWSVSIYEGARSPITNGLVWCRASASCFIHPPDTWSPNVWLSVNATVERIARCGVLLTPMCRRLYQEEVR